MGVTPVRVVVRVSGQYPDLSLVFEIEGDLIIRYDLSRDSALEWVLPMDQRSQWQFKEVRNIPYDYAQAQGGTLSAWGNMATQGGYGYEIVVKWIGGESGLQVAGNHMIKNGPPLSEPDPYPPRTNGKVFYFTE